MSRGARGLVNLRASSYLALLVVLACFAGCQKKSVTSLLDVVVDVDSALQLDQVQVTATVDGRTPAVQTFQKPGSTPLTWEVVISNVAKPMNVALEARGLRGGNAVVVFDATAVVGSNSRVVATLPLTADCANKTCSAVQTCLNGGCVPPPVFTGDMDVDGGAGHGDAGADAKAQSKHDGGQAGRGGGGVGGGVVETDGGQQGLPAALSISPGTNDFGTVVTGLSGQATFQITNGGGQPSSVPTVTIDGADAGSFTVSTNGCSAAIAASANCLVTVQFSPTAAGMQSARLNVTATMGGAVSAMLQGLAVAPGALTVTPNTQSFSSVLVGTAGTPVVFTVQNTGGAATGMLSTAIQNSTELAISTDNCAGKTLASQGTCTVSVTLSPTTAGQKSGTLVVSATPGGTASASLTGVGLAAAVLGIAPVSGTFGTSTVGVATPSQTFTITNNGGVAAGGTTGLAVAVTGANATDFVASGNTCTGMLSPTAPCTVKITFTPGASGARSATLTVSASPGGSVSASLSGMGVAAANITLAAASGSSTSFGNVVVGATATQTFTVKNTGGQTSAAVTLTVAGVGFSIATPGTGDCVSGTTTLAVNASCTVHVVLSSTTAAAASGSLTASASGGGSGTLTLSGTVVSQGALSVSPTSSSFTSELPGSQSPTVTFTISNSGGSATGALSTSITGSTEFTISSDSCATTTLAANSSCAIAVVFKPALPGAKTGSLSVSASPGGTATAALSATGLAPAALTISAPNGFGNVYTGQTSAAQTLTVTNSGDVASGAITDGLTGTNVSEFAITADTCSGKTLGTKLTCSISVVFKPTTTGNSKTATLTVSGSPGGSTTASLTGNGQPAASLHLTVASGSSNEFGSLVINSGSQTEQFVVTNTGQQPATALTLTLTGTDFKLVAPSGLACVGAPASNATALAGGASCTVSVTFAPTAAVSRTATLSISAATGGSDSLTTLHGLGVAQSAISVSATSLNFGSVLQGGKSPSSTVTLTNMGGSTSGTISTSLPAGLFAIASDGCKGTTLAANASCAISLTFSPTTASATPQTNTLSISATPGGSPTVTLSGLGARLGIDQTAFVFPPTATGGGLSAARSFTISNPTSGTAGGTTGLTVTLTGSAPNDFVVNSTTCSGSLGGSGICTVVVTFRPFVFGLRSETLTVSGVPGGSVTAALSGQGQAPDGTSGCVTNDDCVGDDCATYYLDADGDGYGNPSRAATFCGSAPNGYANFNDDCDDTNPAMNVDTSECLSSTTRGYCLEDGVLQTQTCTGGGCAQNYCVGTVSTPGVFTCGFGNPGVQCTTAQGCSYGSFSALPPACGTGNGGNSIDCDGTNDCPTGQFCCLVNTCSPSTAQYCATSCAISSVCENGSQICNPLASDCPAGQTCSQLLNADLYTGQGFWVCAIPQ